MPVGFHTSIAGGLSRSVERITGLGCGALQIFIRNPRSWQYKPVSEEEIGLFRSEREKAALWPVVVHTTYLINLSSPDEEIFEKSIFLFKRELAAAEVIGADYLVTHLGSSRGSGAEAALGRIKGVLDGVRREGLGAKTMILAENSAGGGDSYGSRIDEIALVLRHAGSIGLKMGLCFDTCHGFAAGYPMRTSRDIGKLIKVIDGEVGLKRLKLIHLNDSKGGFNSGVDRHEAIGRGRIGYEGLNAFLKRRELSGIPLILETPKKDINDDLRNLRVVMEMKGKRA